MLEVLEVGGGEPLSGCTALEVMGAVGSLSCCAALARPVGGAKLSSGSRVKQLD